MIIDTKLVDYCIVYNNTILKMKSLRLYFKSNNLYYYK